MAAGPFTPLTRHLVVFACDACSPPRFICSTTQKVFLKVNLNQQPVLVWPTLYRGDRLTALGGKAQHNNELVNAEAFHALRLAA